MFKKNFIDICARKNVAPSVVCLGIGLTPSSYSKWTDDSVPRKTTLIKIANYLGVTVEDLLREDGDTPTDAATDPIDAEIARLFPLLKDEDKADVLRYIEFLRAKNAQDGK